MVLLPVVLALLIASVATPANAIEGVYNTGQTADEDGAEGETLDIKFHVCDDNADRICATVINVRNATEALTLPDGRPVIGFTMITGLQEKSAGQFRKGRINAVDESIRKGKMKWYGVKVDERDDGALEVRGCVARICPRTMVWTPVTDGDLIMIDPNVDSTGDAKADPAEAINDSF